LSNELERLQGKPTDCDPLLESGSNQKTLKKKKYQKLKMTNIV